MPYKLVHSQGEGYYVVSPHGHYLSKHPLTHEQAMKQETAVRLTELRKEHKIPDRPIKHHPEHSHVHHHSVVAHDGQKMHKEDASGALFVPVGRDIVHPYQVIPTRDIFAPLPLPAHHLRKKYDYSM